MGMTILSLASYTWKKKLRSQGRFIAKKLGGRVLKYYPTFFHAHASLVILGTMTRSQKKDYDNEGRREDMELPIFDLAAITNATDNFSSNNKLGEGGFGPVYKVNNNIIWRGMCFIFQIKVYRIFHFQGILPDGKDIAVKRLSKNSRQGQNELKNEVILNSKLQHRNLVTLLGCCIQENENMLIYEYMSNRSLDSFIFGMNLVLDLNQKSFMFSLILL